MGWRLGGQQQALAVGVVPPPRPLAEEARDIHGKLHPHPQQRFSLGRVCKGLPPLPTRHGVHDDVSLRHRRDECLGRCRTSPHLPCRGHGTGAVVQLHRGRNLLLDLRDHRALDCGAPLSRIQPVGGGAGVRVHGAAALHEDPGAVWGSCPLRRALPPRLRRGLGGARLLRELPQDAPLRPPHGDDLPQGLFQGKALHPRVAPRGRRRKTPHRRDNVGGGAHYGSQHGPRPLPPLRPHHPRPHSGCRWRRLHHPEPVGIPYGTSAKPSGGVCVSSLWGRGGRVQGACCGHLHRGDLRRVRGEWGADAHGVCCNRVG
mmetsp:Transcript_33939/g.79477  ORF Transcript_33939/g.79477 Transcript_33939/m.79477 type:complete len:316 (+) Transcript_33939:127-1074(+)